MKSKDAQSGSEQGIDSRHRAWQDVWMLRPEVTVKPSGVRRGWVGEETAQQWSEQINP
jgi:hypothetical protein